MNENRIEEEIQCLRNVLDCLESVLKTLQLFTGVIADSFSSVNTPLVYRDKTLISTVEQTIEFFDLASTLLSRFPFFFCFFSIFFFSLISCFF